MATYKKDQGRLARMAAFWTLALLIFYGCVSLHRELVTRWEVFGRPLSSSFEELPLLRWKLNGGLLISALVLGLTWWLLYRWQQTPKVADVLIETETEMTKVTWPTFPDAFNSSLVVILVVTFLMAYLAGADYLLGAWTTKILTGRG